MSCSQARTGRPQRVRYDPQPVLQRTRASRLLDPSGWYNPYTTASAPSLNGCAGELHLAVGLVADTQLAPRQAGDHAELLVPDRRVSTAARWTSTASIRVPASLNSAMHGRNEVVAKDQSAAVQLSLRRSSRRWTARIPLHAQSTDRNVRIRQLSSSRARSSGNLQLTYDVSPKIG